MSWRLTCLVGLLSLASAARVAALPAYDEGAAQSLGHVTVVSTPDSDPKLVTLFGEVCEVAAAVYQQDLKLTPPPNLRICVSLRKRPQVTVVTDRRSRVFINYGPPESEQYLFMADYDGRQAGPVHALCRAVAELYNPHQVPGLEQLLASKYAVPAILDQLGAKAWLRQYNLDGRDGEACFKAHAADAGYLGNHPRWAAAVALGAAVDKLRPEAFAKTLAAVKGEGRPALAMLRKLLVAQDPALEAAFADYDRAVDLPLSADGSLLISSFENAEQCALFRNPWGCQVGVSTEWATDGKRCAALTYAPQSWPRASFNDPDWRYADWSTFSSFEFDGRNPGERPLTLAVFVADDESGGHGYLGQRLTLPAKGEQHVVLSLMDPGLQHPLFGVYYGGQVRLNDISHVQLTLTDEDRKEPVVLWVDNLRLRP